MFDVAAEFEAALSSGNWAIALPLIYLAGLGTALTPCVYPMIAITVSVFGARQAKTKVEGAMLSTAYVLGMCALMTPLGVFSALSGGFFGEWLNYPVVLIGFAVLFVALALAMFGLYELNLPPALQNKLAGVGGIGLKGAFALGFAMALIATPCTGPALVALLAWIGNTGNVGLGAGAMFLYALGLGTLFWVVGTFAVSLPKSGRWMEMVKSVFGIVLCVMALYWIKDLIPGLMDAFERTWLVLAIALGVAAIGLAVGAVHLDFHEPNVAVRVRKALGIVLATTGSFAVLAWMITPALGLTWREDFQAALAEAREEGRPYIVDFGASWCQACGELERNTFTDPRVIEEGSRFVAVHVDLSPGQDTEEKRALLRGYAQRGLPLVVLHASDGSEVHRVTEFIEAEELLSLMQQVR
ncbi:protein-disulfide reductase DsbD family protein [Sandaracinus amylolyticus]|uniref:protein-disulfide reductase DsbD family protein n=1 Tax=Sandaracinus amylolyticus TaxID=927083 RepID=UPI001F414337|nr:cytochrome c biogenesis protein CcdA [Sandaracinus amylolyticus]UJR82093.1 Cytochrome c-type biogenesis protein DsbD, protein-disulfide reductase [Sandaracinus amylolyticus]